MPDVQPDDGGHAPIEFRPSADAQVVHEGPRDLALVFLGASLVAGVGDPKGQGWVTRVVGRTQDPDLELTAYLGNNGVEVNYGHDVSGIKRAPGGGWDLALKHPTSGEHGSIRAKFVFVGAGGNSHARDHVVDMPL